LKREGEKGGGGEFKCCKMQYLNLLGGTEENKFGPNKHLRRITGLLRSH
jgi:hypothetical protein